jgi:hypothetical protein
MKEDLNIFENGDNFNFFQMEDNLDIFLNGRRPQFSNERRLQYFFFIEDDLII